MFVGTLAFAVAFKATFLETIRLIFWTIFVDFLLLGTLIATFGWWVSNTYLRSNIATTDGI